MELLESRQTNQVFKNVLANIDVPSSSSNYDINYRKFMEVVNFFLDKGKLFPKPATIYEQILKVRRFGSYGEFENWMLTKTNRPNELAFFHEEWFKDAPIKSRLTIIDREKLASWLAIFLQFDRFTILRPQVSSG